MADLQGLVDALANLDDESCVTVITSVLQARPELAPPVVTFAVPELTYPPAKALMERRALGVVKSLDPQQGFGWIECQELFNVFGKDVFLQQAQFAGMQPGQNVSFAVVLNKDNKPQAYDLQLGFDKGGFKGGCMGKGPPMPGMPPMAPMPNMGMPNMGGCGGGFPGGDAFGKGMGKDFKGGCGKGMVPPGAMPGGGCMPPQGCKGGMPPPAPAPPQAPMAPPPSQLATELQNNEVTVLGDYTGSVKSYNPNEGFGFIDCNDLKGMYFHDTYLHGVQLGDFSVGDTVQFTAYLNNNGKPQAKELRYPDGSMPQKKQRMDQNQWGGWAS